MSDSRHHTAVRTEYILVPVPIEIGSPKQKHLTRPPGSYPRDQRQPWKPADQIPARRLTRSEKVQRLLDDFARQDEVVRAMMRPNPRAWWAHYGRTVG